MDAGIGRVLNALRRTGNEENTLVTFTSDASEKVDFRQKNAETFARTTAGYEAWNARMLPTSAT
jgi:arylsulfatase A-like enzyme